MVVGGQTREQSLKVQGHERLHLGCRKAQLRPSPALTTLSFPKQCSPENNLPQERSGYHTLDLGRALLPASFCLCLLAFLILPSQCMQNALCQLLPVLSSLFLTSFCLLKGVGLSCQLLAQWDQRFSYSDCFTDPTAHGQVIKYVPVSYSGLDVKKRERSEKCLHLFCQRWISGMPCFTAGLNHEHGN